MIQGACLENTDTSAFSNVTDAFNGGDQHINATISVHTDVFAFDGMNVGALLGSATLTGPVAFTVFSRTSDSELGTFSTQLDSLDLTGNAGGHSFELMLDPAQTSPGQTTIASSGGDFRVHSFFDVFVELSIDSGAFIPDVAPRVATLESVPEPGTAGLAFLGLAGLVQIALRKAKQARSRR